MALRSSNCLNTFSLVIEEPFPRGNLISRVPPAAMKISVLVDRKAFDSSIDTTLFLVLN